MSAPDKMLRQGDPCPCCGQPIQSSDPDVLELLTTIRDHGGLSRFTLEKLKKMEARRNE